MVIKKIVFILILKSQGDEGEFNTFNLHGATKS